MTDQADTSAHGTSGQRRLELTHALELIQAFSPFYGRLLAAGVTQLWIEYETKEGIGDIRCQAGNAFGEIVTSQMSDDLVDGIKMFVSKLLEYRYPKWSLDAGAHGRINWSLKQNDLIHYHHQPWTSFIVTEHRGL